MSKIFMPPTYSCYSEYIASYGRTGKTSGRAVRVRDRVFAPLYYCNLELLAKTTKQGKVPLSVFHNDTTEWRSEF